MKSVVQDTFHSFKTGYSTSQQCYLFYVVHLCGKIGFQHIKSIILVNSGAIHGDSI